SEGEARTRPARPPRTGSRPARRVRTADARGERAVRRSAVRTCRQSVPPGQRHRRRATDAVLSAGADAAGAGELSRRLRRHPRRPAPQARLAGDEVPAAGTVRREPRRILRPVAGAGAHSDAPPERPRPVAAARLRAVVRRPQGAGRRAVPPRAERPGRRRRRALPGGHAGRSSPVISLDLLPEYVVCCCATAVSAVRARTQSCGCVLPLTADTAVAQGSLPQTPAPDMPRFLAVVALLLSAVTARAELIALDWHVPQPFPSANS